MTTGYPCRLIADSGLAHLAATAHRQSAGGKAPLRYSERGEFKSRFRLASMCMVQTRKIIAPNIENASGHTTRGWRTNEVASPATEQNRSAPIAFRKPASLRNARRPITQAATRAATATNPRIRGTIMLISTDQGASRHTTVFNRPARARARRQPTPA